jgi:hypothetical protein
MSACLNHKIIIVKLKLVTFPYLEVAKDMTTKLTTNINDSTLD